MFILSNTLYDIPLLRIIVFLYFTNSLTFSEQRSKIFSMNTQIKENIVKSIENFNLPKYHEIPDTGLYLDQTVQYMNRFLQIFPDLEVTPSMISNYVKKGLISRSIKKLYSREQIAFLIFIAFAKNVLSMENIRLLIDIKESSYDTPKAYDYFRLELLNVLEYVFGLKETLETVGFDNTYEKLLLRNTIISVAHKLYLEKVFNEVRSIQN